MPGRWCRRAVGFAYTALLIPEEIPVTSTRGRWLLSSGTSRLFFASSVIVLASGCLIVALAELSSQPILEKLRSNPAFYVPLTAILILNAICAIFLLVGMLWYWVSFDDSRRIVKLLWLASFVGLGWYSMSVYYFLVYRRQKSLAEA